MRLSGPLRRATDLVQRALVGDVLYDLFQSMLPAAVVAVIGPMVVLTVAIWQNMDTGISDASLPRRQVYLVLLGAYLVWGANFLRLRWRPSARAAPRISTSGAALLLFVVAVGGITAVLAAFMQGGLVIGALSALALSTTFGFIILGLRVTREHRAEPISDEERDRAV